MQDGGGVDAYQQRAYLPEIATALKREGFSVQAAEDGLLQVRWNGQPLCRVNGDGVIRYDGHITSDPVLDDALSRAIGVTGTVTEYMALMLKEYANEEFWREHPIICFDTPEEAGEYEVVAAFYSRVYYQNEEGVFRYYRYTDLTDPARFEEYVSHVRACAQYDTGVDVRYGDELLTLSTCSYHTDNGRFVVVARKSGGVDGSNGGE